MVPEHEPEDELHQLDVWLSAHVPGEQDGLPAIRPQLEAADRLVALAERAPSPQFAARLEARFLEEARRMAAAAAGRSAAAEGNALPEHDPERGAGGAEPPSQAAASASHAAASAALAPPPAPRRAGGVAAPRRGGGWLGGGWLGGDGRPRGSQRGRAPRFLWPAAAAVLALIGSLATLAAAAAAAPGSSLYALHRWEQGVRVSLASGPADRARLHLQYAQSALRALDTAVAQHAGDQAYLDAVGAFVAEEGAAELAVGGVSDGATHDALVAHLFALRSAARRDLRAALPSLDWASRLATTLALAQVGERVPLITQVSLDQVSLDGDQVWECTVTGSGFHSGAVLLVDGQPSGTTISTTSTTLVASVELDSDNALPHRIGVGNPDGTAVQTAHISIQQGNGQHDDSSTQATPPPGNDQGGSGGPGGTGEMAPTPTTADSDSGQ
jgi:hypothetical protein